MKIRFLHIIVSLFLVCFYAKVKAQELESKNEINIDDLGDVTDEFQEYFFEALTQKAITNYDKAIEALEKCMEIKKDAPYLYAELGKNYLELKKYEEAQENFEIAIKEKPNNRYLLEYLFEVYFAQYKYPEAIEVVEKLTKYEPLFKEQLANLYYLQERYNDALSTVEELNDELGTDPYREGLLKKILLKLNNPAGQISKLEEKIQKNPKEEQNYLNLIYLHSQNNNKDKALEVAQKLLKKKPKSEMVHLALYKFYLDDNKVEDAITSMKVALNSSQLDEEAKYKVINDFLIYVNINPAYENQLVEISNAFSEEEGSQKIFTEIGNYFYEKDKKELALNFYERGLKDSAGNFKILRKILLLQLDLKRFEKAKVGSELAIEIYPTQPILYLINGVALNNLSAPEEAIDILSIGLDYVIDDLKMESDFYNQIGEAYLKSGDSAKASEYKERAFNLKKKS